MQPVTREVGGHPGDPVPISIPPGWVTVDPGLPDSLTVDEVKILTGEAAHDAAVDAGIITEDDDLPNDMFIANPDESLVAVSLAGDAAIEIFRRTPPGALVSVTASKLAALVDGSYTGAPVYGVVPGDPMLMTITIEGVPPLRSR